MTITRNRTFLLRYIFPSICASLGTWQIYRWQRKQILLKELAEAINSEPVKMDSLRAVDNKALQMTVEAESTGERALLGPRGLSSTSGYGYTLFEKARLTNGEVVVLNRGNLAINDANSSIPLVNGPVTVVFDKEERKPLFARSNTPDRILWKNWTILKEALKIPQCEPVRFLKVVKGRGRDDDDKLTMGMGHELTIDQIPNRHLEYIATWYSLASLSFLMSFIRK